MRPTTKMKHIDLLEHHIRELIAKGEIKSTYVSTNENLADLFTKGLGKNKFIELKSKIGCISRPCPPASVEGGKLRGEVDQPRVHYAIYFNITYHTQDYRNKDTLYSVQSCLLVLGFWQGLDLLLFSSSCPCLNRIRKQI